jgi:DNA primase catalytic subunit
MEYTQEQIDQMIAEATKGLFTQEELEKRVTSEVDRRVESGIKKGLETHKKKWEQEFSERAKLSAEELAKKDLEEKLKSFAEREREISRKANQLEAKSMLSEADIPKSHYENFIGILVTDDAEATKSNVQNFINMFNATKNDIETKVKSEYANVKKPKTGNGNGTITKEEFNKMGYADKIKFKQENPELYKDFIK